MSERKRISAHVRNDVYEELKDFAKQDKRSISNLVDWILYKWVEDKKITPPKINREVKNLIGLQVFNGGKEAVAKEAVTKEV